MPSHTASPHKLLQRTQIQRHAAAPASTVPLGPASEVPRLGELVFADKLEARVVDDVSSGVSAGEVPHDAGAGRAGDVPRRAWTR